MSRQFLWQSALCMALLCVGASAVCTSSKPSVPACTAAAASSQRKRKELRDLSVAEWQKVVDAIWIMKNYKLKTMADGITKYGANFKCYDYFVVKHAVVVSGSTGDMGHFSNGFATWHGGFVLEFEVSLLAVDPSIGALPYWDGTGDIMTSTYFGSPTGTGANNIVADGKFPNFPVVSDFNVADWSKYMAVGSGVTNQYTGNGGFLRGTSPNNALQTAEVTRYGTLWTFAQSAQDQCASGNACWNDWYSCIEGGSSAGNFHSGAHQKLGGKSGSNRGDFEDPTTSPNDPIFMFHHANVDRNRMQWMDAHAAELSVYYGFGVKCFGPAARNCPTGGLDLDDVSGALWPFTSTSLGLTGLTSDAVTHANILCNIGPTTSPYKYSKPVASATGTSASTTGPTGTTGTSATSSTSGATGTTSSAMTSEAASFGMPAIVLSCLCFLALC